MSQGKEIKLYFILSVVLIVSIIPTPSIVFSQITPATTSTPSRNQNLINNADVLQASVTALIGILIFLTLERKFEKKHDPLRRMEIDDTVSNLKSSIHKDQERITSLREKSKRSGQIPDPSPSVDYEKEIARLETRLEMNKNQYNNYAKYRQDDSIRKLVEDKIDDRLKKLKNREDAFTLSTVSILTLCIGFMIFVPTDWIFYPYLSRGIFAVGLALLVSRVYLSTKDPQDHEAKIRAEVLKDECGEIIY